jgi:hypothetical protein
VPLDTGEPSGSTTRPEIAGACAGCMAPRLGIIARTPTSVTTLARIAGDYDVSAISSENTFTRP